MSPPEFFDMQTFGPESGETLLAVAGVDKRLVAKRFGIRARTYDSSAAIQQNMETELLALMEEGARAEDVGRILELGCGTGTMTAQLARMFPKAELVAIDISPEMIEIARGRCKRAEFVVADAEDYLSTDATRYDLIASNATVQWFDDPVATIESYRNRLNSNGALWIATFGAETFQELSLSFDAAYREQKLPPRQHVMSFLPIEAWHATFPDACLCRQEKVVSFSSVRDLLLSLRAAGTSYSSDCRPLDRRVLRSMYRHYGENFRSADLAGIAITYELIFLRIPALAGETN